MDVTTHADQVRQILQAAGVASRRHRRWHRWCSRAVARRRLRWSGRIPPAKTALVAALTGSERAREEIGAGATTTKPVPYTLTLEDGRELTIWDTPDSAPVLPGTTKWPATQSPGQTALLVAVDEELLSDEGRRALRQLVFEGRKLGATLYVITKADRPEDADLQVVADDLRTASFRSLHNRSNRFRCPLREYLEEPDADELTRNVSLLRSRIIEFVVNEAQRRAQLTGAVRLLDLIDRTIPALANEREPEPRRRCVSTAGCGVY